MAALEMTAENFTQVLETGTVLVDWWAPWCAPCRAFGPIYDAAAARHPEATFAKVDTEREPGLAAGFQIQSIPTLMVFRDGLLLFRQAGLIPAAALEELLKRVAEVDMDAIRESLAKANAEDATETTSRSATH